MIKKWTLLAVALSASLVSRGQDASGVRPCETSANTTVQITNCADKEVEQADAAAISVLQKLKNQLSADPGAVAKLDTFQQAWERYRDAYVAAAYPAKNKIQAYGSFVYVEIDQLKIDLSHEHKRDLEMLLKQLH